MSQKAKRVGRYELGRTLGEGNFAKVKFATNVETKEHFAIKALSRSRIEEEQMVTQIKREISVMKLVRHPNVVNLIEVLASKTTIFIVLELVTGGELFDMILATGKLPEDDARVYFHQLIDGVSYCHERGVCHRDLKPENLLLDDRGRLKISDFGLSALPEHGGQTMDNLQTTCGTPNYVAPEVLRGCGYDGRSADVWSCGCILYVLCAGKMPFDEPQLPNLFLAIAGAKYKVPKHFSSSLQHLIGRILVSDPRKRANMEEIRTHTWFTPGYVAAVKPHDGLDPSQVHLNDAREDWVEIEVTQGESLPKPALITAFDLISSADGLDLNALFEQKRGDVVKRQTRFVSMASPDEIFNGIRVAAETLGFRVPGLSRNFKIRLEGGTRKGPLVLVAQVFEMCAGLYMVEMRKVRGDAMDFYNLYRQLLEHPKCHAMTLEAQAHEEAVGGSPAGN